MKSKVKSLYSAFISAAVVTTALFAAPAVQADQIFDFKIVLPGGPTISNINELGFGGSSFVKNTFSSPTSFTFTDNGVFTFNTKNGGSPLGLGAGQLSGDYQGGTGSGTLGSPSGSITFDAGGTFDIYYNPTQVYGTAAGILDGRYGAATGIKIATFRQLAGGGGAINPDSTPSANGQLQLNFIAEYLLPNTFFDSTGAALPAGFTLGFVTANASQDNANNCAPNPGGCNADQDLIKALAGSAPNPNQLPFQFLVSNGAQLKLAEVPEPGTIALLGLGLLGFTFMRRKSA